MRPSMLCLAVSAAASAALLAAPAVAQAPTAQAPAADGHQMLTAKEVKWGPGPASLPPGAQAAVLYGDPTKEGLFALRLKLPDGYHIAPHSHPKPEIVTVLSGTFRLGMGPKASAAAAKPLDAGSFFAFDPGMTHFAYAQGETVVQLNSTGPWAVNYVNPADDPRKK